MKFRDYFSNDFETSEQHYIDSLRTRYYRCRKEDVEKVVEELIEKEKGVLKGKNDTYSEIFYECSDYSCTVTVISPKMQETAIDLKVTTYKLLPLAKGVKVIERLYKYFDGKLPFKGVSLYK